MSSNQRHSTKNFTNYTSPVYSDNLASRMGKRERPATSPKPASPPKSARNPFNGIILPTISSSLKARPIRQHNAVLPKGSNFAENAATVELTVKKHNSNKKASVHRSWSKILQDKDEEDKSSFHHYDPLRTLHFLAKELQSKIRKSSLGDPHMEKIVKDMEHALTRVPPEVTTSCVQMHKSADNIQQSNEINKINCKKSVKSDCGDEDLRNSKHDLYDDVVPPFQTKPVKLSNKCAQTSHNLLAESDLFQKQLALGTKKLDKSCKDLQTICKQLKSEKNELESTLRLEKDTVKHLRKQIAELEEKKIPAKDQLIEQLGQENSSLSAQLKKCQAKLDFEQGLPFHELRDLVQQLQVEKTNAEKESIALRHQLTISDMEKEKYLAILGIRDGQIEEIRNEMLQLQEVVNEQLVDLQKTPFVSSPSSQSTLVGTFIDVPRCQEKVAHKETGDSISHSTTEVCLQREDVADNEEQQFRKVPSGDSAEETQAKIQLLTTSLKNSRTKKEFVETNKPTTGI